MKWVEDRRRSEGGVEEDLCEKKEEGEVIKTNSSYSNKFHAQAHLLVISVYTATCVQILP